jgi:hypothetical protein
MSLFGMMLSFAGFIFVNMIALYNYNCKVSTYYRHCYNVQIRPLHYVFIVLGTPSAILSLIFFIYFKLKTRVGRPVWVSHRNWACTDRTCSPAFLICYTSLLAIKKNSKYTTSSINDQLRRIIIIKLQG